MADKNQAPAGKKEDQQQQGQGNDAGVDETCQEQAPAEVEAEVEAETEAELETEAEADTDSADAANPLEALVAERTEALNDKMLRSLAEVDNVKRRAAKDVENAHKFAVEKLLNNLFPVLDSLEKAVETAAEMPRAEAIAEGVGLSLKLFIDTLEKSGVEQIDPLGEPFDPQRHEAMTMVPNPDAEPNSVMDVMAKGYILNGRLVRAAKVIVVQG